MRFSLLYEEGKEGQEQGLLNVDYDALGNHKKRKKKKNNNNNNNDIVYRYDWLINDNVETIQNKIIDFVRHKKKEGMSAKGIDNYINPLEKFYRIVA